MKKKNVQIDALFNYDTLSVVLKKDNAKELVARYAAFGWTPVADNEDRLYFDLVHITFRRPHAILHKDRLQYLQVVMEGEINALSEKKQKKNARSITLGTTLGLLCAFAMMAGLALFFLMTALWIKIAAVLLFLTGILVLLGSSFGIRRMTAAENLAFEERKRAGEQTLAALCAEAAALARDRKREGKEEQPEGGKA